MSPTACDSAGVDFRHRPDPRVVFMSQHWTTIVTSIRIALANLRRPAFPDESVELAEQAVHEAASSGARVVCFPECFVPGYCNDESVPPSDAAFLDRAWLRIADAARQAEIAVVLGTERVVDKTVRISVLVINADGSIAGFQDKVQLDPSEEARFSPGTDRQVFQTGPLTFGIAICHEGFRYPETVRWAAQRGALLVFHPHFDAGEPGGFRPTTYGDPENSFHEKAALCRAAENNCFYATVNCASAGSPTTSAIVRPDGSLLKYQPYGEEGLLIADIELSEATGLLASRLRPQAQTPVVVRDFRESDTQTVIDLWRDVFPGGAPHHDPETSLRLKLAVDRDLLLVAEADGEIAGTVMGGYDGHRGWLYSVAVHSLHRRRGIGSVLIRQMEGKLKELGCLKVNLQVLPSNPDAVSFYEALGFDVEDRISMGKKLYGEPDAQS